MQILLSHVRIRAAAVPVLVGRCRQQRDHGIEAGIVIGRKTRDISEANAPSAVFGYTIVNDVSARNVQKAHGQ